MNIHQLHQSDERRERTATVIRDARPADAPILWTLSTLPNIGDTADPSMPLALPPAAAAPLSFPDLADVQAGFVAVGGAFLVAERSGHVVGMAGFRPDARGRVEVLRVRVHPAARRLGIGRALMAGIEARASAAGFAVAFLDTATNQPEAVGFYRGLGYAEVGRETRPEWSWTLVYFAKRLPGDLGPGDDQPLSS